LLPRVARAPLLAGLEAFAATLPHAQRKRLAAALRPIVDGLEEAT
jgi:hypothetical protein